MPGRAWAATAPTPAATVTTLAAVVAVPAMATPAPTAPVVRRGNAFVATRRAAAPAPNIRIREATGADVPACVA